MLLTANKKLLLTACRRMTWTGNRTPGLGLPGPPCRRGWPQWTSRIFKSLVALHLRWRPLLGRRPEGFSSARQDFAFLLACLLETFADANRGLSPFKRGHEVQKKFQPTIDELDPLSVLPHACARLLHSACPGRADHKLFTIRGYLRAGTKDMHEQVLKLRTIFMPMGEGIGHMGSLL